MARPKQENLTQRELELMQVFWHDDPMTADAARERLQKNGRDLSYTTVANLCRGLREKGYLRCENDTRPFVFAAAKPFESVSNDLLGDLINRLFFGSRERLLSHLFGSQQMTAEEQRLLRELLDQQDELSDDEHGQANSDDESRVA